MSPLAIIEAIATLLWAYAGVTFLVWVWHLKRTEKRTHVAHVFDLIGNLVPAMICILVVVIVGAMVGLPSVVVIIAILFPAALAFGAHMSLNDIRGETNYRIELTRIAIALLIGLAMIYTRQFA